MGREKLKNLEELKSLVEEKRLQGKTIVFTNGCFDIIHIGHVRLLQEARTRGDMLIVGVNSDLSVKRLKGPSRPLVREEDRAEIIAALESVDYVVIFAEDTPVETIKALKPHIHVKGGDYDLSAIPEAEVIKSYGGELWSFRTVDGYSTTTLVEKLRGT
jgi:D-glycero-beta-D-manno-heptose 1-phosphate adenylyltransferase